ncbi:hypothetical protein C1645_876047 [Glomus cerebriforme]|uniref:Uncharacterized protein n=1 Tax=Glomus cerebriforme TaxID=658196 RepID=A0A397SWW5_9GLOM|nr:hypothetical protein C1645_876047 [Glomus cerebriforme]
MAEGETSIKQDETTTMSRRTMESIKEPTVRKHEETSVITNQVQNLYDRMMRLSRDLFQSTPKWFQECSTTLYENGRQYSLIVDFSRSFIVFFAVPFVLFISWSIGSILFSGITFAAIWTVINFFSIFVGLIFIFPFFALALFFASITTFIVNIGRLTINSGKYIYRATLTFFRYLVRPGIGQRTDKNTEEERTTFTATIVSATKNRDTATITNTAPNIYDTS